MKFKKIEVYGFKSFADKLPVEFSDGITAIVGPNGCGKSNIADAVRWVLGEQSAKTLRGNSMQDVIFVGTEKRKSMSFCEVLLYFDNTDRQLFGSLDYNEVVISRKLYRSGESQYLINGTPCRLKDITDLLRDGRMGREGYSIIGQGRVDELLSSKPEARRAIFEEAAGISKSKARKTESERKLERVRDNMSRVNDILQEKQKQLEPLAKQAEAAQKYLNLHDTLRFNEINAYIYQYDTASQAKAAIYERLRGINEELVLRTKEHEDISNDYRRTLESRESIDKDVEEMREQLIELTVGIANQDAEVRLYKQQLTHLMETNETLKTENIGLNAVCEDSRVLLEQKEKEVAVAEKNIDETAVAYDKCNNQYRQISDELAANADEIATSRKEELDAVEKLTDIKSNMSRLIAERDALNERSREYEQRLRSLKDKIQEQEPKVYELNKEIENIKAHKNDIGTKLIDLVNTSGILTAELNQVTADFDKLSNVYHTKRGQFKILKDIKESYDAYNNSVKNLLLDAKINSEVSSLIEGVVAELITVQPKFETAIEMTLGNAIQNIVVRTEEDAKFLVEHLKKTKQGRVTFLPINAVKPRRIEDKFDSLILGNGSYGRASEVVKFDEKYRKIFDSLLGGTVIVDNMEVAVQVAKKSSYAFKIVTLDGDIINPQGSITGGSRVGDRNISNIFTHERELKELTVEVKEIENKMAVLTERKNSMTEKLTDMDSEVKTLREELHNCEISEASKSEALSAIYGDYEQTQKDFIIADQQYQSDINRISEITGSIDSVGELEELIRQKRSSASELNSSKEKYIDELRTSHNSLREEVTELLIKLNNFNAYKKSMDSEIERLTNEISLTTDKIQINAAKIAENDAVIKSVDTKIAELTLNRSRNDADKVRIVRERLAQLDELKKNIVTEINALDEKRTQYNEVLQTLGEKKLNQEFQLQKVDTDIEFMEQRIREEYDLDYDGCLAFKAENFDIYEGTTAIAKLKRQIAALGNINLDAIEQSKVVCQEFNDLNEQRMDLEKAESDLVKIIKDLSADMLKIFNTQFEQIRENFAKIFRELFDGGTADLLLLESDDPLSAGVEIVAQPPQKKLQSIALLSGGERALTAIAILFAILRLRPMPFCILDEIEAALDDANATRFANYLRRFSKETQFIVITHRKPTMELADNLYGVTMEEKGVSKVVSVKLSEAVKQAEDEIGA